MSKNKNWFQRNFTQRSERRTVIDDAIQDYFALNYGSSSTMLTTDTSMKISAVYRCVEVVSDAVAQMPIDITRLTSNRGWTMDRNHPAYYTLNTEPNQLMSRFTLVKTLVSHVLLNGNGYIQIHRDGRGNPKSLELINEQVEIYKNNEARRLTYKILKKYGKKDVIVDGTDMIHILNFTYDGIVGVSTLTHASMATSLSYASEKQAKGFFAGGANLAGILKVAGKVDATKAAAMKTAWRNAFETNSGTPNGVAVIETGTDFVPTTINPKDSQMLESRQYSVQEICRFFGVSPTKAFDTNAASYNSVEAGQLAFLTDTIQPIAAKIENELNRKLFRPSERSSLRVRFDTSELLRTDSDSQANFMMKMFQVGAATSNEIREKIGHELVDGGDTPYVQVNMQPLKTAKKESDEEKLKG